MNTIFNYIDELDRLIVILDNTNTEDSVEECKVQLARPLPPPPPPKILYVDNDQEDAYRILTDGRSDRIMTEESVEVYVTNYNWPENKQEENKQEKRVEHRIEEYWAGTKQLKSFIDPKERIRMQYYPTGEKQAITVWTEEYMARELLYAVDGRLIKDYTYQID